MSTLFTLADTGATELVRFRAGLALAFTSSGSDTFFCVQVVIDADGQLTGTIDSTHATPATFTEGDLVVFPSASPPTITTD